MLWNDRHHISNTKDNEQNHPFYKTYFDKPLRKNDSKSVGPVIQKELMRIDKIPRSVAKSKAENVQNLLRETKFSSRFNVATSKDNQVLQNSYREYFDQPRPFDNTGQPATAHSKMDIGTLYRNEFALQRGWSHAQRNPEMTFRNIPATPEQRAKEKFWNTTVVDYTHFNNRLHKDNRAQFATSQTFRGLKV